jgi:hypothetical protein
MGQQKIKNEKRKRKKEPERGKIGEKRGKKSGKRSGEKEVDRVNPEIYNMIKDSLTPEQIKMYKEYGENMYNTVDFNTSDILNNEGDPLSESVAYISEGIKSGLHPSFLDEDEIKVMVEWSGEEWYKKFGYDTLELEL